MTGSRLGTGRICKTSMMAIFIVNHVTGGIIFRKSKPKKPTTHCVLYHFNVLAFLSVKNLLFNYTCVRIKDRLKIQYQSSSYANITEIIVGQICSLLV